MLEWKKIKNNPEAFKAMLERRGVAPLEGQTLIHSGMISHGLSEMIELLQSRRNDFQKQWDHIRSDVNAQEKPADSNLRLLLTDYIDFIKDMEQECEEIYKTEKHKPEISEMLQDITATRGYLETVSVKPLTNKEVLQLLLTAYDRIIPQLKEDLKSKKQPEYDSLMAKCPNWLCDDVPDGVDESDNKEVHRWGQPLLGEGYCDHIMLGGDDMDFAQAAKVSGARFVYLRGDIARLERALGQWMLDQLTEFGFQEMSVPYLVNESAMWDSGQLPKFRDDLFQTKDGRFLIPTGEVSLINWFADKILKEEELPFKVTALTPCFRSEAGSAGRDVRGMIRHHQFHKVEMVIVCKPDQTDECHEWMTRRAEMLLERLELPYRRMLLCSKDTGQGACKTYDLEVWLPSAQNYREISSCSRCDTYQSRRMKTRFRDSQGKMQFVHTLNGSGLPIGRTLVALLENHQQDDRRILIPEVLQPYMKGQTFLRGLS